MPFTAIVDPRFSDLVINEREDYRSRGSRLVSLVAGETSPQGTVLYRAKGTNPDATYAKVTAGAQLVTTNEFAILAGDAYSLQESVVFATATPKKALVWVRDAEFKEAPVLAIHDAALSDAEWATLKLLLTNQNIFLATSAPVAA
jgi:hypothetical protein